MMFPDLPNTLAVKGVQFKILGQVFPVLRHDVLGPLSNASLAAAMLRQAPEGAPADALQQRCQRLSDDVSAMLEEGVGAVRGLEQWLSDDGAVAAAADLLQECRKLVFSQLLLSRRTIRWPEQIAPAELPRFSSRYLALAWLLSLISELAADAELELDASEPGVWRARLPQYAADSAAQPPVITPREVELLAAAAGWRMERQDRCWSLYLPTHLTTGELLP